VGRVSVRSHVSRVLLAVTAMATGLAAFAGTASAAITPTATATDISSAVTTNPLFVTGAAFDALPPEGTPNATADADTALGGFPRDGSTYGILTTGDPLLADDPNTSGSSAADLNGPNVRGDTDFDVTILRIDLLVPATSNCLAFDFRFLSEEFPEFVGTTFNDAFIAELDTSDWTTSGSTITAPNNFATDQNGNVISINAAGAATMSAGEAAGTTYDGATGLLQTRTVITPGAHQLFLSIFDQGDQDLDSATFIDNLTFLNVPAENCQSGVILIAPPPPPPPPPAAITPPTATTPITQQAQPKKKKKKCKKGFVRKKKKGKCVKKKKGKVKAKKEPGFTG
jgi:hypothetical protein